MSSTNGDRLDLVGDGAAYLRVSTDQQDTRRQIEAIHSFEKRHGVTIKPEHWFEDHGWERDADAVRPEFNRLLRLAQRGVIKWIVVDRLDRFGAKRAKRLMRYLDDLEEAGCKLYDASGKEWTGEDDATEIQAWVAGKASTREQREKSYRTLTGMVEKARAGEWLGGPPKLGFDVACFDRATGAELWRVIWEGRQAKGTVQRRGKDRPLYHILRRRIYPDGRTERLDGNVVFCPSKDTQVMRLTPTQDQTRLAAAQAVFKRYAVEAVSCYDLAMWLNGLGIRNSFGGLFQSRDITKMLKDEAYLGFPTFGKRPSGRFHCYKGEKGVTELEPGSRARWADSAPADIIRSKARVFEPLIDRPTWDAVQRKMQASYHPRGRSPRCPQLYLAGLLVCAGCGKPMVGQSNRHEYHCGTWNRHRTYGTLAQSPCEHNGVRQEVLEEYIGRYLDETQQRLELLTERPDARGLTGRLQEQEGEAWHGFKDGIARLTRYLAQYHPEEYAAIVEESHIPQEEGGPGPDDFVDACVKVYRANFDPGTLEAEITQLEAEHTTLTQQCLKLTTPLAIAKANKQLAELEGRIEELRHQQQDASAVVEQQWRQMYDLQQAIADARLAMKSETGAQALRQRAQALRGILCRIECEFGLTGKPGPRGGNKGKKDRSRRRSRLVALTFIPVVGDVKRLEVDSVLQAQGSL